MITRCSRGATLGRGKLSAMAPQNSPTVRHRRLARELLDLREGAGVAPEDAARQLGWSRFKVRNIETAKVRPKPADINEICDLYGVDSTKRAGLLQLAREARQRGWWAAYGDVFSGSYVGLEDDAAKIRSWQPQLIPGLLQTEDYAREVINTSRGGDDESVNRRVQARMARRTLLSRPNPPALHAVLDEAVLRRQIGGPDVLRDQLAYLKSVGRRDNITIQVLPFDSGTHPGLESSFVVLSFTEPADPDMAFIETKGGDIYVEAKEQVTRIKVDHEQLTNQALPEEESAALIAAIMKE